MPSAADTLLDSGFAVLLASAGESLLFPDLSIATGIVNRSFANQVNGVALNTSIEIPFASVPVVPTPGQTIEDGLGKKHLIWRSRRVNSNLIFLCFTFSDLPSEAITINAVAYTCYVLDSTEGTDLQLGGFANEDVTRVALSDRPTVIPLEGQAVTFRTRAYSVVKVDRGDAGAPVIIDIANRTSSQQS